MWTQTDAFIRLAASPASYGIKAKCYQKPRHLLIHFCSLSPTPPNHVFWETAICTSSFWYDSVPPLWAPWWLGMVKALHGLCCCYTHWTFKEWDRTARQSRVRNLAFCSFVTWGLPRQRRWEHGMWGELRETGCHPAYGRSVNAHLSNAGFGQDIAGCSPCKWSTLLVFQGNDGTHCSIQSVMEGLDISSRSEQPGQHEQSFRGKTGQFIYGGTWFNRVSYS